MTDPDDSPAPSGDLDTDWTPHVGVARRPLRTRLLRRWAQRERVPFFERPKQPHDWRWVVGGIGRTLITTGMLMFAFVGYQLWGTGLQTARAQKDLKGDFHEQLAVTTTSPDQTTAVPIGTLPVSTTTTTTIPIAPYRDFKSGDAIALMDIPKIGMKGYAIVEGVGTSELRKGPGHFPETPLPGQLGNSAIAGHRTTYGHPFFKLDQLRVGDRIEVLTLDGHFVYTVWETKIVSPADYASVIPTRDPTLASLTLATCHPAYTSKQRLIVTAVLSLAESDVPMQAPPSTAPGTTSGLPDEGDGSTVTTESGADTSVPSTDTGDSTPDAGVDGGSDSAAQSDTFSQGWFSDTSAIPQLLLWLLPLIGICLGAWYAGKAANRLYVSVLVGILPFLIVLYFVFENLNRLLPPGL